MAERIRCSRCKQDLDPETFAPSHRKPGHWCRACRREYMRSYYHAKVRPKRPCWRCKDEMPPIGGCFNGCGQNVRKAEPPIRYTSCLICGNPFAIPIGAHGKTRTCKRERCQAIRIGQRRAAIKRGKLMPRKKPKKPHHRGTYQVRAREVTTLAYLDTTTRCWQCGLTMEQIRKDKPKAKWTAGHVNDGEIGGELLAECSPCNFSRGATMGNRNRRQSALPGHLRW